MKCIPSDGSRCTNDSASSFIKSQMDILLFSCKSRQTQSQLFNILKKECCGLLEKTDFIFSLLHDSRNPKSREQSCFEKSAPLASTFGILMTTRCSMHIWAVRETLFLTGKSNWQQTQRNNNLVDRPEEHWVSARSKAYSQGLVGGMISIRKHKTFSSIPDTRTLLIFSKHVFFSLHCNSLYYANSLPFFFFWCYM